MWKRDCTTSPINRFAALKKLTHITRLHLHVLLGLTCLRGSCWVRPVWTWWRCCWCWWRCWGCWSCSRCCSGETLAWPSRRTHLKHINTCSSCIILGWILHHVTDDDDGLMNFTEAILVMLWRRVTIFQTSHMFSITSLITCNICCSGITPSSLLFAELDL